MGAADVVPFVPLEGVTMDDCVALARRLGERLGTELGIPVFLYARAATRPARERLPDVRKGEFEGLREEIGANPEKDPDFGPTRIHPTAGATAVGIPARIVDAGRDEAREAKAEKLGFSAYAVTKSENDPLSQAIHGLLDHAVETDRRIELLLKYIERTGVSLADDVATADKFDPKYLSKIVD